MTSPDITWPRHTERLTLRPVTSADIDEMLTYRNDPEVRRWLIKATVDPDAFRAAWLASADDPHDHSCAALVGDELIGTGMLEVIDGMGQDDDPASKRVEGMLGYILNPAHAGRGYATELTINLLSLAFDDLGLRRVTAGCFADNIASRRVLEKAGMRLEQHGVQDSYHAELGWIDGCTYGLLKEEWDARDR
ncbi:GCN5 family acetyltransferase [Knoellia sinensis KCTC 19936]|uniref:GCN5 family acetyltransferase n=1 Tax=Knoellia sinensis KCTC 19936 TaxID=1385520 RepID=A0A0A0J0H7_9MICO|nr:GNAT family protein [Knoellia sinensis]KGN30553.1 GCN5 family acetyltransferase [Knoellia sinensis KCTC 19936]